MIIEKVPIILLLLIANVCFHELFHYLSAKALFPNSRVIMNIGTGTKFFEYKDVVLRVNLLCGYCEFINGMPRLTEQNRFAHQYYYVSGMFGNLALGFICLLLFPYNKEYYIFCYMLYIGNMLLFFPTSDFYKVVYPSFDVRDKINYKPNDNWTKENYIYGVLVGIAPIISFIYLLFSIYYSFF